MAFKNEVKSIQTAGYNGMGTVLSKKIESECTFSILLSRLNPYESSDKFAENSRPLLGLQFAWIEGLEKGTT